MLNIVWFKRDLRVYDHTALAAASQHGPVLPLYVAEPELWAQPDASGRQWDFIAECLTELRAELAALGQPLIIRKDEMIPALEALRRAHGPFRLWSHEETGNGWTYARDLRVAAWMKHAGLEWTEIQDEGVFRRMKSREGWARNWDRVMGEPLTLPPRALPPIEGINAGPIPSTSDLGLAADICPRRQTGGREAGLETLYSFLHERGQPYRRAMSSPSLGAVHCSRLSPFLAWGALSLREVTQSTWARQRELKEIARRDGWRGSMSSFVGRLHWRNHFMQKLEDEPRMEFENLHPAYDGLRPKNLDSMILAAWEKGETGLPFVDACMRSLNATGWINFRMRAMLAAVSSYHLWQDWRRPGEHLARQFTDYEPGIHWSQMQMQSGTTGINTPRIYNPIKQGYDQDASGVFTRKWVPELNNIPDDHLQEPWRYDGGGTVLGRAYPWPIIDHKDAAKTARQKIWAVRKTPDFRQTADDIVDKHASRSKPRGRRKASQAKAASDQMSLPL